VGLGERVVRGTGSLRSSFLKKKEPKDFCDLADAAGWVRDSARKSLLLLFFRKEDLPVFLPFR
jgi:hypothetical protein